MFDEFEVDRLESIALKTRERFGVTHCLAPDMGTVMDDVGKVVPGATFRVVADHELPDAEAATDAINKVIMIRQSVSSAARSGDGHARATVAHELAHLVLNHSHLRYRTIGEDKGARFSSFIEHDEIEAIKFAARFLAPTEYVEKYASNEELVEKFQLSPDDATFRLEEVQSVLRRRRGEKRPLPPGVIDLLAELANRTRTRLD